MVISSQVIFLGGANLVVYKEEAYPDVNHLVRNLINQIKIKGFGIYSFVGSWTNHSNGYCSVVSYNVYDSTAIRICGTIYAFTGEVYAFIYNDEDTLKIATIGTMS